MSEHTLDTVSDLNTIAAVQMYSLVRDPMMHLYEVCGNRLLVCDCREGGAMESDANRLAQACWDGKRRIADGVVWFQKNGRDDVTFGFVNPDGSIESVCGNGFFAVACALTTGKRSWITISPARHSPARMEVTEDTYNLAVPYRLYDHQRPVDSPTGGRLYDTGSPHVVMVVPDVRTMPLRRLGEEVLDRWNANLTVYSFSGSEMRTRTFERGVNAETDGCGTGALAVAVDAWLRGLDRCRIVYRGGCYDAHVIKNRGELILRLAILRENVRLIGSMAMHPLPSREMLTRGVICPR